ncbi:MAG: RsmG family class I SAM-dependent methyltransferase [Actinomycetota bacterium]
MDDVLAQLERSRQLGFLGPGPVVDHVLHAGGFLDALAGVDGRVIDLGSGGGVPGLVIAAARRELEVVLLEAMGKRCDFLRAAAADLALSNITVVQERAELAGRGALRGSAEAVVARGFGPPAVTAECAAPLLSVGGLLAVSEPPEAAGEDRWPSEPLAALGLEPRVRRPGPPAIQMLQQVVPCPARFPRRVGIPAKRPLF